MKVCMLTRFYKPVVGGIQTHIDELSKELIKRGVEVIINSGNYNPQKKVKISNYSLSNDSKKIKIYYENELLPKLLPGFRKIFIDKDVDIIHIHNYDRLLWRSLFLKKRKMKIVSTFHGGIVKNRFNKKRTDLLKKVNDTIFLKNDLKKVDKIIALNNFEREDLIKIYGIDENKIIVIPNGVTESIKNKLNFEIELPKNYILSIGRLDKIKSYEQVLFSLKNLPEYLNYVLIGPDSGELKKLKMITKKLKLENRVHFLGPIFGELKDYIISKSICVVVPSKYDTQLIVIFDSIINEKPIIGTNIGGIKEIIDEYNCGYTFNFGDISKLSELILNIDKNENIFKIRDVKTAILKKHSWGKISEDLIKLYEGLYE